MATSENISLTQDLENAPGTPTVPEAKVETEELSWYENILVEMEESRYGFMSAALILTACLGAVACFTMFSSFSVVMLAVLAICTVMPLSLMIAMQPMRTIIPVSVASCVLSILTTIVYLF